MSNNSNNPFGKDLTKEYLSITEAERLAMNLKSIEEAKKNGPLSDLIFIGIFMVVVLVVGRIILGV